jgi:hypothetical protein
MFPRPSNWPSTAVGNCCPLSANLVWSHTADLEWTRLHETKLWASHAIWPMMAVLLDTSHSIWSMKGGVAVFQTGVADQMTTADGTPPSGADTGRQYPAQPRTQPGKVAWRGARLVTPQRLVVDFVGTPPESPIDPRAPRPTYEGTAEATAATVIVTVAMHRPALPPGTYLVGAGFRRTVVVELPEPLHGRGVVDGATGQLRPIVDAARLRQPSYLPASYRFGREWVDGDVDRREWWKESARDEVLVVEQGPPGLARLGYHPVVLGGPVIHGVAATAWGSEGFDDLVCLCWAEGSVGYRVCSQGSPRALLPVAELVSVANGLR